MKKARKYNSEAINRFVARRSANRRERVDKYMMLAEKIYKAMLAKGWNQKEFAQHMDKRESEVSKWLNGTHNFTFETMLDISDKLGIKLINFEESDVNPAATQTKMHVAQKSSEYASFTKAMRYQISGIKKDTNNTKATYSYDNC